MGGLLEVRVTVKTVMLVLKKSLHKCNLLKAWVIIDLSLHAYVTSTPHH